VDVKARNAVVEKLSADVGAKLNAELSHRFIIVAIFFQLFLDRLWQPGAAQGSETLDLLRAQERQNARHNRHGQATAGAEFVLNLQEAAVIVKSRRKEDPRPRLDLGHRPVPIEPFIGAFDVAFRVTGAADAEAILRSHESNQIPSIGE